MAIYIVTHKEFDQPRMEGYKSLLVGAYKGHIFGDCFDDNGENISRKNANYCELTGLYWIWKNIDDDYKGIVHYRRYFSNSISRNKFLSEKSVKTKLKKYDFIVPNRVNIFIPLLEQLSSAYQDYPSVMGKIRLSLEKHYPEYLKTYDDYMAGTETYFCNMLICKRELFDEYCEWLFTILFEIESQVDMTGYNDYQKRLFGFISERLLGVWIKHNNYHVCELGMTNTESKEGALKELLKGIRRCYSYYFPENRITRKIIDSVRKKTAD